MKKKYQYGQSLKKYKERHPNEAKLQLQLVRSAFLRNWRRIVKDPMIGIGLVILRICEYGAGGVGYVKSKFPDSSKSREESKGRLEVIKGLASREKFSLSVGSKETRFANINVDVDRSVCPDIVADARFLPFRESAFQQVFFTDVIEHLPTGDELDALSEINVVLCTKGVLVLTTPYNGSLFKFLDPAFHLKGHRHYKTKEIRSLLENAGFKVVEVFTAGGWWACVNFLWYCLVTYPSRKILQCCIPYAPRLFTLLEARGYDGRRTTGYTLFARSILIDQNVRSRKNAGSPQ